MVQCEVSMTIPLNPVESWMATAINVELDDTIKQTTQVTLTSFCGSRLANAIVMPIVLFPVHYQGDPVWQQCLEAISDPEGPHLHGDMAAMAEYAQYSFDL
jgi:predicted PurR-regulated permease PerM